MANGGGILQEIRSTLDMVNQGPCKFVLRGSQPCAFKTLDRWMKYGCINNCVFVGGDCRRERFETEVQNTTAARSKVQGVSRSKYAGHKDSCQGTCTARPCKRQGATSTLLGRSLLYTVEIDVRTLTERNTMQ